MEVNKLILGDNLEILKSIESESVDLIYFDPPFFSNRNYEIIWGDKDEVRSFEDRWGGGISNMKQRSDSDIDGKMPDNTPIQVKRKDSIGRDVIDNFESAVERYDKKLYIKNIENKKPVGFIIAFSFSKGAIEEVARLKNKENVIIKLLRVGEIVEIATKPKLKVEISRGEPVCSPEIDGLARRSSPTDGTYEIEFTATAISDSGIVFYNWDFNYDEKKVSKPKS